MIDLGKKEVLGVFVNVIDYEAAVTQIIEAARRRQALGVTALAVHGVMTGALDAVHRYRLNALHLVVPDGQPVRWALNFLHGSRLPDRVYGPTLMLRTCSEAEEAGLPVYFYGSTGRVLQHLTRNIKRRFPGLVVAGMQASFFRCLNEEEKQMTVQKIKESGAAIIFVGLGCPRQEIWVFEHLPYLQVPMLAVGGAFDVHAQLSPHAPDWMQQRGLEWCYRLIKEPRRLWRRYLLLNPSYLGLLGLQAIGWSLVRSSNVVAPETEIRCG